MLKQKQVFLLEDFDKIPSQGYKRGKIEIVGRILSLCLKGKRKTHILYQANLSFTQVEKYINELQLRKLIKLEGEEYFTTEKGEQVLDLVKELTEAISESS
jgi:predicted transcriptional regulator